MSLSYTVDGITVTYLGRTAFGENSLPFLSEAPEGRGLDTLTRTSIGAAPLLAAFLESVEKGISFEYNGELFYLTSYQPNGDKLWPEVTFNYLGLSDGPAAPIGDDDFSVQSVTITAQVPTDEEGAEEGTMMDVERTIDYLAFQTTWSYVRAARPTGPEVGYTSRDLGPWIKGSRITTSTGKTYAGANAPAAIVTATTPGIANMLLSLRSTEHHYTPFFDVDEVIARMYVGS